MATHRSVRPPDGYGTGQTAQRNVVKVPANRQKEEGRGRKPTVTWSAFRACSRAVWSAWSTDAQQLDIFALRICITFSAPGR